MTQKFTTPCFIRKNTEELRKKLDELGYEPARHSVFDNENLCIATSVRGNDIAEPPKPEPRQLAFDFGE